MDPIAEMFSQLKNAQGAQKDTFNITYSKIKVAILEILKNKNLIQDYKVVELTSGKKAKTYQQIKIQIRPEKFQISRISRPGRRVYMKSRNIPRPRNPRALIVISTSQGLLDGEEARKKGLGGELIAEIK